MTELAILNAEQFDDGVRLRPSRGDMTRISSITSQDRDEGQPSRKRSKTQASEGSEKGDEERKRSRGRPRLDTKDETAADRRRTQIRLAQRAYRNRKETAIQTLEKKVQNLKDANEEMSNAFMQLHDFALRQGMLDAVPDFARQLQATTQTFLSLARRSSEEGAKDDDQAPEQDSEGNSGSPGSAVPNIFKATSPEETTPRSTSRQLFGGLVIDEEPEEGAGAPEGPVAATFGYQVHGTAASGAEFEVITRPTMNNASFPFGMSLDADNLGSLLDPSYASIVANPPSPLSSLAIPTSYSYQERTFGRRLQRSALEAGLILLQMPNPPPHVYAAVFGFSLLFEPRDKIIQRLTHCIRVNNDETLENWRYPFFHLGGAGTFFEPLYEGDEFGGSSVTDSVSGTNTPATPEPPIGNQGTRAPLKPKTFGGPTGPWGAAVEEVRDMRLDEKMRMIVPGFEGNFFDCNEIEIYLRQRGVHIPPAADFVTVEIDMNLFVSEEFDPPLTPAKPAQAPEEPLVAASADPVISDASFERMCNDITTSGATMTGLLQTSPLQTSPIGASLWDALDPQDLNVPNTDSVDPMFTTQSADPLVDAVTSALTDSIMDTANLFQMPKSTEVFSTKRTVTVNIAVLVRELVHRSVCLGRSPGVRPKDVNVAFWLSTTVIA